MKLIAPLITASALSLLLSGCITVHAGSLDYKDTKDLTLSAEDISKLKVDAHAGFIKVRGSAEATSIEVTADILAYDEDIKLFLKKKGNNAVLVANPNPHNESNWFGGKSPKIDLTITIPQSLNLSIDDGSGDITIDNLSSDLYIDDGSGNIEVKDVAGAVKIEDGSGNIKLENIGKKIHVDDGSGNLIIQNAKDDIVIDDGSGDIYVKGVEGKTHIDDGSGDLLVTDVKGHVTIDDGSGDIKVKYLHDGLTILEGGSGSLVMDEVKGSINTK